MEKEEHLDDTLEALGQVLGYSKAYLEQQIEYHKLSLVERISLLGSSLVTGFIVLSLMALVFIFSGIALGAYFAELLDSYPLGYALVAVIYLILLVILFASRHRLITGPIVGIIIENLYNERKERSNQ
ncbi:MAG TPA: hypothetical protein PKA00_17345 [Saprospiraceae bacterium]|nr:hypothetical protein [Saprospiraceae bacterium]HMQ84686.1 hypothetical protein [Saprospiraceae bacterium]